MIGAKGKKTMGKNKKQQNKSEDEEKKRHETDFNSANASMDELERSSEEEDEECTLAKAIQNLSKDIKNMKTELKQELTDFKEDIKQEFNTFKEEIHHKLKSVSSDLRNHGTRLTEAEQRVAETETSNTELRDALVHSLAQQKLLQAKVTDLEGRSRRNNIRIYGIKEGTEGSSMLSFIESFLKTELGLDTATDLQIQRAHRSLGPKP